MAVLGVETASAAELSRLRIAYNQLVQEHGRLSLKYAELREESASVACTMHYSEMEIIGRLCAIIMRCSDQEARANLQELSWRDERVEITLRHLEETK